MPFNGDWQNYRRVVVVEALAPYTLAPACDGSCPRKARLSITSGLDTLNPYYLAEEADELARCFETPPAAFEQVFQFRNVKPALADEAHPDHRLASLLAGSAMTRLPLLERDLVIQFLTGDIPLSALERPAGANDVEQAIERLFGPNAVVSRENLRLPAAPRLRDVYAALVDSDEFRAASGRISASYAW